MPTITVENADAVVADLTGYSGKVARSAVWALNRAIKSGRTEMKRAIASDTGLPAKTVEDALPVREARIDHLEATFGAKLKRIPLFSFKAKAARTGVSYSLGRGRHRIPTAFIAKMRSGHEGVFTSDHASRRRGPKPHRSQLPITELYGPSLGHVFGKYRPLGMARTREAFDTYFAHELARLTGKPGGG